MYIYYLHLTPILYRLLTIIEGMMMVYIYSVLPQRKLYFFKLISEVLIKSYSYITQLG